MTKRIRTAAVAIAGALGLLVAPIALAAPAAAAPLTNVLFFSNEDYTEPGPYGEDETQIAALEALGRVVTVFDGGDGSATAWTAALAGQQALVIPESSEIFDTPVLSVAAADVIADFVAGGAVLLLPTEYQADLLSHITGVDYASVWITNEGSNSPWPRAFADESFPEQLAYSNGTYPVNVSLWDEEHYAAAFPVYYDFETGDLAVGGFPVGTGVIYTLAYDWYPGEDGDDVANRAVWNVVMGLLLDAEPAPGPVPVPQPELAATGSSVDTSIYIAGAAMLLLAGAAIIATSRRKASA